MPTPAQIKKIHVLKNELQLTDEEYRAALGAYGVTTSKALDPWGANAFITALVHEQMRREGLPRGALDTTDGGATLKQRAMIGDLFARAGGTIEYPCAWMTRIAGRMIRDGAHELSKAEASKVIDALKRHLRKKK